MVNFPDSTWMAPTNTRSQPWMEQRLDSHSVWLEISWLVRMSDASGSLTGCVVKVYRTPLCSPGIQVQPGISHSLSVTFLLLQQPCQPQRNMELGLHHRTEEGIANALEAILPRDFCQMDLRFVSLNILFGRDKCTIRVKLGVLEAIPEWVFSSVTIKALKRNI